MYDKSQLTPVGVNEDSYQFTHVDVNNLNVVKALLALHNLKGPHGMYVYHGVTQINDFC